MLEDKGLFAFVHPSVGVTCTNTIWLLDKEIPYGFEGEVLQNKRTYLEILNQVREKYLLYKTSYRSCT